MRRRIKYIQPLTKGTKIKIIKAIVKQDKDFLGKIFMVRDIIKLSLNSKKGQKIGYRVQEKTVPDWYFFYEKQIEVIK